VNRSRTEIEQDQGRTTTEQNNHNITRSIKRIEPEQNQKRTRTEPEED
jgi:hypothetical protein